MRYYEEILSSLHFTHYINLYVADLSRLKKTQMLLSSILWSYNDRHRLSINIARVMSILLLA
jgi:hypothetical protein